MNNRTIRSIKLRRGLRSELATIVLNSGEPGWTTDTHQLYLGDGVTLGGILIGDVIDTQELGPVFTTYRGGQNIQINMDVEPPAGGENRYLLVDFGQPGENLRTLKVQGANGAFIDQSSNYAAFDYKEARIHVVDREQRVDPDDAQTHIRHKLRDDTVRTIKLIDRQKKKTFFDDTWSLDRYGAGTYADIRRFTGLTSLRMPDLGISDFYAGAHPNLTYLDLDGNNIRQLDPSGMPLLDTLLVRRNQIEGMSLYANSVLRILDARFNELATFSFAGLSALEEVNLSFNQITTPVTLDLSGIGGTLRILNMRENLMTDINLDNLSGLLELNLRANQLTTVGPNGLSDSIVLRTLDIRSNQLGDGDVNFTDLVELVSAYINDNIFTTIDLSAGGGTPELGILWAGNPGLVTLTLDNSLGKLGDLRLLDCPDLASVGNFTTHTGVKQLVVDNSGLVALDVSHLSGVLVFRVLNNTSLTSIVASGIGLDTGVETGDNEDAIIIDSNTALTSLDLSNNEIKSILIDSNTLLTDLDLSENPDLSSINGSRGLIPNPSLEQVELQGTQVSRLTTVLSTGAFVEGGTSLMPNLDYLDVRNTQITQLIFSAGGYADPTIQTLRAGGGWLNGVGDTPAGIDEKLVRVWATDCAALATLNLISAHALKEIYAENCNLTQTFADLYLPQAVEEQKIERIRLSNNANLTGNAVLGAYDDQEQYATLKELLLDGTGVTLVDITNQKNLPLANFKAPSGLQTLFIAGCSQIDGEFDISGFGSLVTLDSIYTPGTHFAMNMTGVTNDDTALSSLSSVRLTNLAPLESVYLPNCSNLAELLVDGCPNLVLLNVGRTTEVSTPTNDIDLQGNHQIADIDLEKYSADIVADTSGGAWTFGKTLETFNAIDNQALTAFIPGESPNLYQAQLENNAATTLLATIFVYGVRAGDNAQVVTDLSTLTALTDLRWYESDLPIPTDGVNGPLPPTNVFSRVDLHGTPRHAADTDALITLGGCTGIFNIADTGIKEVILGSVAANSAFLTGPLTWSAVLEDLTISHGDAATGWTLDLRTCAATLTNLTLSTGVRAKLGHYYVDGTNLDYAQAYAAIPASGSTNLQTLHFNNFDLAGGAFALTNYANLTDISLDGLTSSSPGATITLTALPGLTEFEISNLTNISGVTLNTLTGLTRLYIGSGFSGSITLNNLTVLTDLTLDGTFVTGVDLSNSAAYPSNLEAITLANNILLSSFDFSGQASLTKLHVYDNNTLDFPVLAADTPLVLSEQLNDIFFRGYTWVSDGVTAYGGPGIQFPSAAGTNVRATVVAAHLYKPSAGAVFEDAWAATVTDLELGHVFTVEDAGGGPTDPNLSYESVPVFDPAITWTNLSTLACFRGIFTDQLLAAPSGPGDYDIDTSAMPNLTRLKMQDAGKRPNTSTFISRGRTITLDNLAFLSQVAMGGQTTTNLVITDCPSLQRLVIFGRGVGVSGDAGGSGHGVERVTLSESTPQYLTVIDPSTHTDDALVDDTLPNNHKTLWVLISDTGGASPAYVHVGQANNLSIDLESMANLSTLYIGNLHLYEFTGVYGSVNTTPIHQEKKTLTFTGANTDLIGISCELFEPDGVDFSDLESIRSSVTMLPSTAQKYLANDWFTDLTVSGILDFLYIDFLNTEDGSTLWPALERFSVGPGCRFPNPDVVFSDTLEEVTILYDAASLSESEAVNETKQVTFYADSNSDVSGIRRLIVRFGETESDVDTYGTFPISDQTGGVSADAFAFYSLLGVSNSTTPLLSSATPLASVYIHNCRSLEIPNLTQMQTVDGQVPRYEVVDVSGKVNNGTVLLTRSSMALERLIIKRARLLEVLGIPEVTTILEQVIVSGNQSLQAVNVQVQAGLDWSAGNANFSIELQDNPNLISAQIDNCPIYDEAVTTWAYGPNNTETFRSLSLNNTRVPTVSFDGFPYLYQVRVTDNTNLRRVEVTNCGTLENAAEGSQLSVVLDGSYYDPDNTGTSLTVISFQNSFVDHVSMQDCRLSGDHDFALLPILEQLYLDDNPLLGQVKAAPSLQVLSLNNANRAGFIDLAQYPALKELYVKDNVQLRTLVNVPARLTKLAVNRSGVRKVVVGGPSALTTFNTADAQALETIEFPTGTQHAGMNFYHLTANAATGYNGLQRLVVGNMTGFTQLGLSTTPPVAAEDGTDNSVSGGAVVTNKLLFPFGPNSRLRQLISERCGYTTAILGRQDYLTDLDLEGCHALTSIDISECSALTSVDLRGTNLPEAQVLAVLQKLGDNNLRDGELYILDQPGLPVDFYALDANSTLFRNAYNKLRHGLGWKIDYDPSGDGANLVKRLPLRVVFSSILNVNTRLWTHSGLYDYNLVFYRRPGTLEISVAVEGPPSTTTSPVYVTNSGGGVPSIPAAAAVVPVSVSPTLSEIVRSLFIDSLSIVSEDTGERWDIMDTRNEVVGGNGGEIRNNQLVNVIGSFFKPAAAGTHTFRVEIRFSDFSGFTPGVFEIKDGVDGAAYALLSATEKSEYILCDCAFTLGAITYVGASGMPALTYIGVDLNETRGPVGAERILIGEYAGADVPDERMERPTFNVFTVEGRTYHDNNGSGKDSHESAYKLSFRVASSAQAAAQNYAVDMLITYAEDYPVSPPLNSRSWKTYAAPSNKTTYTYDVRLAKKYVGDSIANAKPGRLWVRARDVSREHLDSFIWYIDLPKPRSENRYQGLGAYMKDPFADASWNYVGQANPNQTTGNTNTTPVPGGDSSPVPDEVVNDTTNTTGTSTPVLATPPGTIAVKVGND